MQRVLVLGPPGAGKSTQARALGQQYGLPVFHLDQFFHQPGWGAPKPEVFRAEVERLAQRTAWVIDGNFTGTLAPRLQRADTIYLLEAPRWLSMIRVIKRVIVNYGQVRADMPPGCPERFDFEFLRFAWGWNQIQRLEVMAAINGFHGKTITLSAR